MDLIYERVRDGALDAGYLTKFNADFDITTNTENVTNDFEITMSLPEDPSELFWKEDEISTIIYVEGTEWGGEIRGAEIDIEANTITYTGKTWRGLLSQYVIEPPSGQDYKTVSGNVATIIRQLPMNSIFTVADTDYESGTFQFNRYITTFEGITDLLKSVEDGLRFILEYKNDGVIMKIAPARDLTNLIEVSQDYNDKVRLKITYDHETPHHLICLGQGELKNRQVVHYYADGEWNITTTEIPNAHPVDIYDYSSSKNITQDGLKKYKEIIQSHRQIDVNIEDLDVQLSDIISAKDYITGQIITAEITGIVWKCENYGTYQIEEFDYKTEVRT